MFIKQSFLVTTLILLLPIGCLLAQQDWPQWRGKNRDGVWKETGIVQSFTEDSLPVTWRQKLSAGYTGPTVADGRVFVMDRIEQPNQIERILCFDAKTGDPAWQHSYPAVYRVGYPAGPRASVTIDHDRAYAIGSMGHFHCLQVADGEIVWSHDLNSKYQIVEKERMPIWGIAASPIVHDELVIVQIGAADGASVVAFDKFSGREKWRALNDRGQYSSPILHRQNGQDVLICWTGDSCAGINPATGDVFWQHPIKPRQMPIGVATPIVKGDRVFLTSFYDGAHMLRMTANMGIEPVWSQVGVNEKQTRGIHSMIGTPVWVGDSIIGVDSYGELRCLDAGTGERIWTTEKAVPRSRWSTIHFVRNADKFWLFNERGELLLANLSRDGYEEISRAKLIEPTTRQLRQRGGVCWSHPAFAYRNVYLRNDNEIICVSLADE